MKSVGGAGKRERLFRGKKKADGTWVTGFYWNDGIKFHYIRTVEIVTQPERKNEYSSIKDFNVYPETVSEYTGLTDKHGRKIFEGEMVETNEKYCPKGYVAYRDDMARFVIIDVWKEPMSMRDMRDLTEYLLIGNIHDNPELLEVKK